MKLIDKIIGHDLDRQFAQLLAYERPSAQEMDSITSRVWESLRREIRERPSEIVSVSISIRPPTMLTKVALVASLVSAGIIATLVPTIWSRLRSVPPPALIETVGGGLLRVAGEESRAINAGEPVAFGEAIRSSVGVGAAFRLADGSNVEMRPNSELALERADDGVRVQLRGGSVIITAARQRMGHLYVQTKDVTVSVVGTVFLVNAEEAGSRVAVIQGEVDVRQGAASKKLFPGEQVATNPLMELHPVGEEISWSHRAPAHLALLQQAASQARTTLGNTQESLQPKFEVASIKVVQRAGVFVRTADRLRCRGVDGILTTSVVRLNALIGSAVSDAPPGRCTGTNVDLISLIALAYDVPVRQHISGDPDWPELYQIEAKAENLSTATKEQFRQMVQALLADRFELKVHRETKEVQGYVLLVGKNGAKIKETSGEEENLSPFFNSLGESVVKGNFRLRSFAQSLGLLDSSLFPVIDRTSLPGIYDVTLTLRFAGGGPARGANVGYDPPLPKAIEEQLGLRLESGKVPVEYLVVDHVEKPSAN
jgi:uncharacterized protein (TIGR03435 family)